MSTVPSLSLLTTAMLSMQRKSWEQGLCLQAMLESGQDSVLVQLSQGCLQYVLEDGRPAMLGDTHGVTDPCSCAPGLRRAACLTSDPALETLCAHLDTYAMRLSPRSPEGLIYHITTAPEYWSDSLFMLPPMMIALDPREALRQFFGWWACLHQADTGLLAHRYNPMTGTFPDPLPWGGGNGWALSAMPGMAEMLPDSMEHEREKLKTAYLDLLDHVLFCLRPDDTFGDVLTEPDSFSEVNLCQMTAYSIFRAARMDWVGHEHLRIALRLRRCAHNHTDTYGIVHSVCGAPRFSTPGTSCEAQAFAILMESALLSL